MPPYLTIPVTLNTLDAVEIPTTALGTCIGFTLIVRTEYGELKEDEPIKVWALNQDSAQNEIPIEPLPNDLDDNVGFILGDNPTDNSGGTKSIEGGVVQLGHPPHIRSIGVHFASIGNDIRYADADIKIWTVLLTCTDAEKFTRISEARSTTVFQLKWVDYTQESKTFSYSNCELVLLLNI